MKTILTIVKMSELPNGWAEDFPFDALSVKPSQAALARVYVDRINRGRAPGKEVELHIWEWCGFTNQDSARAFAERMAKVCNAYGATRFYANAEAEWSGVEKFPRTETPYINMFEFMVKFYLLCHEGCELVYNGFSWSRTGDGRKLHDADLIKGFYAWCPMIYGVTPGDITKGFASKLDKYAMTAPNTKRIPMIGVGRIDDRGFVWGHWKATREAIKRHKPDEVAFYFGNGAKSRYFGAHEHHQAVVDCAKELATW